MLAVNILIFICQRAIAQSVPLTYTLSGKIVDSATHKPLSLITIRLNDKKSEFTRVMVTKDSGLFTFSGLTPVPYQLSLAAVGYQQKSITVNLSENTSLGIIYLSPQTITLKEVAVTANKPIISQKADRIVYDLKADPESKGSSLFEMMHKIPFISLDGSDNILLKGNSSYRVLINGKPATMLNGNLTAILKSMPASTIQKIEVITIPPSKYDAEGLAGIINIITNKKVNEGYNGTLNVNESGPIGGPGIGGSFTAKLGKLGVSAFGGGSIYNSPQTGFTNSRLSSGPDMTDLQQSGLNKSTNKSGYFGSQLSFEIDSLSVISGQFDINGNHTNGTSSLYSLLTAPNTAQQTYQLNNNNKGSSYGVDASVNYQLGFKSVKNRFLTFSYQYSTNPGNQSANVDFSNQVNQAIPDYKQNDHQKFKEQTMQIDFVTPLNRITVEAGVKAIFRNNASDFGYDSFNARDGQFEPDSLMSDQYTNTQRVLSAYNSYQLALKGWNISAGARLEQTDIRAIFISSQTITSQDYLRIVPAVAVSRNFKDENSISFGFSQRIRRPGINRLNPYVDRSDPNFVSTGNPNLRPVLLNDLQAGYNSNKKLSLNFGLDYSFVNNLDLKVVNFDPASQVTSTTYANVGKAKSLGANFNLGYPVSKWYNVSLNGNLMYLWLSGPGNGMIITNNRYIYFAALSNAFSAGSWRINADLNVISRNPNGLQGTSNGFIGTSLSVSKELIKNKLGFAAGIKNAFTRFRANKNESSGPGFLQNSTSMDYFRSYSVSINYNFGGLRGGIKKSKSEIRNDDLSN
eukprot:gene9393-9473_t